MLEGKVVSDEQLNDPAQRAVQNFVRDLPEDSLSMAWRSGLNEKLIAESQRYQKRSRWLLIMRPIAGFALAGCLAVVLMVRSGSLDPRAGTNSGATGRSSIEAQLLDTHEQVDQYAEVAGTGLRPTETMFVSRNGAPAAPTSSVDWDEVDVDSL